MSYRNVKHKLWKKIVQIARRNTGIRAICIAWLAVYYSCRLLVRAVIQRPQAVTAFILALCMAFVAPGYALAESYMLVPADTIEAGDGMGNPYRLEVTVTPPDQVVSGYTLAEFEMVLENKGTLPVGLKLSMLEQDNQVALYTKSEENAETVYTPIETEYFTKEEASGGKEEPEGTAGSGTPEGTEEPEGTAGSGTQEGTVENGTPEGTAGSGTPEGTEEPEGTAGSGTPEGAEEPEGTAGSGTPEGTEEPEGTAGSGTQEGTVENGTPEGASGTGTQDTQVPEQPSAQTLGVHGIRLAAAPNPMEGLGAGEKAAVYAVLPVGLPAGNYSWVCRVEAENGLLKQDIDLSVVIKEADSEGTVPQEPTTETDDPGLSGEDTEKVPEEPDTQTEDVENPEEEETEGDDLSDSESKDEAAGFLCEVQGIACSKGYNLGSVFFAMGASHYTISLSDKSTVSELFYRVGEIEGTVPVVEDIAEIEIPENISGVMEIYCVDQYQREIILHQEYIINEKSAPLISYRQGERDGQMYAQVIVEEDGEIISGINELHASVDGKVVTDYDSVVLERVALPGGSEVPLSVMYEFPLEGRQEHSFEIVAQDNNGNVAVEYFLMHAEASDIVRVVLPTTFKISIVPDDAENQLYGEDIILCNKSDFPLQVDVASAEVIVDHTIPEDATLSQTLALSSSVDAASLRQAAERSKSCDMTLNLMLAEDGVRSCSLPEGITRDIASFVLAPGNENTDVDSLLESKVERVESLDYSVMYLRGTIDRYTRDCWENGDLKVKIIFNFKKYSAGTGMTGVSETVDDTGVQAEVGGQAGTSDAQSGTSEQADAPNAQPGVDGQADARREE